MLRFILVLCLGLLCSCDNSSTNEVTISHKTATKRNYTRLVILGNLQDAGRPHIGCNKSCCSAQIERPDPFSMVVSLGIIDPSTNKTFLIEATPDLSRQLHLLNKNAGLDPSKMPDGVFMTHGHIGHYTGLQYFGKEATNAQNVPVYAMPRMREFLSSNGPWSQLVSLENIALKSIENKTPIKLTDSLSIMPFMVPHRDEYTETVGYKIVGPNKSVLFIPDIDKWNLWEESIAAQIATVDYAFLDGTFYHGQEIAARDISQIPHPFIEESLALFDALPQEQKNKIYFIHFNHTNPVLNIESKEYKNCISRGFNIAQPLEVIEL